MIILQSQSSLLVSRSDDHLRLDTGRRSSHKLRVKVNAHECCKSILLNLRLELVHNSLTQFLESVFPEELSSPVVCKSHDAEDSTVLGYFLQLVHQHFAETQPLEVWVDNKVNKLYELILVVHLEQTPS